MTGVLAPSCGIFVFFVYRRGLVSNLRSNGLTLSAILRSSRLSLRGTMSSLMRGGTEMSGLQNRRSDVRNDSTGSGVSRISI